MVIQIPISVSQIYDWNPDKTIFAIHLEPTGARPADPAIVTMRENNGFPLLVTLYAAPRTLHDGMTGASKEYLEIKFCLPVPTSPPSDGGVQINVFQEGVTGYRFRGPFG